MTKNPRTDMAMELKEDIPSLPEGILCEEQRGRCGTNITRIHVTNVEGAEIIGKPMGRYITVELSDMRNAELTHVEDVARIIAAELQGILPEKEGLSALVVGLGNRAMTADALGSAVIDRVFVTRHIKSELPGLLHKSTCSICAIAPGVLGLTGIETAELCRGLVRHVKPCAVIAIDALAAYESERICTTVQITNTGIQPGSGVGNHRLGLTEDTLGVKVIAVGVPMVVYASTIARDAMTHLMGSYGVVEPGQEDAAQRLLKQVAEGFLGDMVVTPREIDELVLNVASLLSDGINQALQPMHHTETLHSYLHI